MKLYIKGNSSPAPIPNRIRLSNGRTRTDSSTFTEAEIADAGYVEVALPPISNTVSRTIEWNKETETWDYTDNPEYVNDQSVSDGL